MSVTIDLPPEIQTSLAVQAAACRRSLTEYLRLLLTEQASGAGAVKTLEERVKLWRDVSSLPDSNPPSVEQISRESVYGECARRDILAAELLALGQDCAARLKEPWRSVDHAELLYDSYGLPRWSSTPRR